MTEFRVFGVASIDRAQHVWPETNQSPVKADSPREAAEQHFRDRLEFIAGWPHTPPPVFRDRLAVLDSEKQELRFFEHLSTPPVRVIEL